MSDLTRRRFVTGSLAAGAAVAAGAAPADAATGKPQKSKPKRKKPGASIRTADVAVVGGGFAGLMTARNLVAAGKSVVLLEARNRVGGRVWNHDLGGGVISERGGTFVGPTQDRVTALAAALGIGTFPTYDTGKDIYINGSTKLTFSDTGATGTAPPDPALLVPLATLIPQVDKLASTVPVEAPWTAPNAAMYDAMTLETYVRQQVSFNQVLLDVLSLATRAIFGAEPRELSMLFVLFYIASSGDQNNPGTFERNFDTRGGAQQSRFIGGSQALPLKMAAQLGSRVVLSAPVRQITQGSSGVTVVSDKLTVKAKQVVVAIPPALAGRIDYDPLLPFQRDQLTQRYGMGTLAKVAATYPTPFWREQGLTGQGLNTAGPIALSVDDSPPDGSMGILFGFVGGDQCRSYSTMSAAARENAILSELTGFFGSQASKPTQFFETFWAQEEYSRGCPVGFPSMGTLTAYGPYLRAPIGRIHWAGTETSDYWNGYMDGAVRSGERVAAEVLATF